MRALAALAGYVLVVAALVAVAVLIGIPTGLGFALFAIASGVFAWAVLRSEPWRCAGCGSVNRGGARRCQSCGTLGWHRETTEYADSDEPSPAANGFRDELLSMLDQLAPPELDREGSLIGSGGEVVHLVHRSRPEWDVVAYLDTWSIVVDVAGAHEHFEDWDQEPGERPWTTVAVDFVAEILCGEIAIERSYRGRLLTRVRHGRRDDDGSLDVFSEMVPLTPAPLFWFLPRRVEVERPDFGARRYDGRPNDERAQAGGR